MSALPEPSRSRPSLAIWSPDSSEELELPPSPPPPQEDRLTMSRAFDLFCLPEMGTRSPDTIGEYRTHLRRWSEFWSDVASGWRPTGLVVLHTRMNNPGVQELTRPDLLAFREWLQQHLDEFSNRTINKHLGSLHAIGDRCIREGKVGAFPKLDPLNTDREARKITLSYDEADALKRACRVAEWPTGLPHKAPLYWETLVVGFCVYGFRTQEQVRYESRMRTLEWGDLRFVEENPHPDGRCLNPHGWLVYTPQKQKGRKPKPLSLPIIEAYRRHLDAIRPPKAEGPVFPFPIFNKAFYETWAKIRDAAGIAPKPDLDGTQPVYEIRHLRKTATTWINDHGATIGMPAISDNVTGHAKDRSPDREVQSRVTREHYDNVEKRVLRALSTLPLPESFQEPLSGRRPKQLSLF